MSDKKKERFLFAGFFRQQDQFELSGGDEGEGCARNGDGDEVDVSTVLAAHMFASGHFRAAEERRGLPLYRFDPRAGGPRAVAHDGRRVTR